MNQSRAEVMASLDPSLECESVVDVSVGVTSRRVSTPAVTLGGGPPSVTAGVDTLLLALVQQKVRTAMAVSIEGSISEVHVAPCSDICAEHVRAVSSGGIQGLDTVLAPATAVVVGSLTTVHSSTVVHDPTTTAVSATEDVAMLVLDAGCSRSRLLLRAVFVKLAERPMGAMASSRVSMAICQPSPSECVTVLVSWLVWVSTTLAKRQNRTHLYWA